MTSSRLLEKMTESSSTGPDKFLQNLKKNIILPFIPTYFFCSPLPAPGKWSVPCVPWPATVEPVHTNAGPDQLQGSLSRGATGREPIIQNVLFFIFKIKCSPPVYCSVSAALPARSCPCGCWSPSPQWPASWAASGLLDNHVEVGMCSTSRLSSTRWSMLTPTVSTWTTGLK